MNVLKKITAQQMDLRLLSKSTQAVQNMKQFLQMISSCQKGVNWFSSRKSQNPNSKGKEEDENSNSYTKVSEANNRDENHHLSCRCEEQRNKKRTIKQILKNSSRQTQPSLDKKESERKLNKRKVKHILSALTADGRAHELITHGSGRFLISWLLYKTHLILKDKNLIYKCNKSALDINFEQNGLTSNLKVKQDEFELLSGGLHSTTENSGLYDEVSMRFKDCISTSGNDDANGQQCSNDRPADLVMEGSASAASPDCSNGMKTLRQKMLAKYTYPTDIEANQLQKVFPEPETLFHEVMQPVSDAGLLSHSPIAMRSHLDGLYWKAKLQLVWPRKVCCVASHFNKAKAVQRAYLVACQQLMDLGLIVRKDGVACPVDCDSVVGLLEQISEFGETSLIRSKGKGFKIILEKIKAKSDDQNEYLSSNYIGGLESNTWHRLDDSPSHALPSLWSCTIHVGWPLPFSVRMVASSLPSAQLLALLTVASNLKILGLLQPSSLKVNAWLLQNFVLTDMAKQWGKRIESCKDVNHLEIEQPNRELTDAVIYVDASIVGYGSYLQLNDTSKMWWLCESWLDQPYVISSMFMCPDNTLLLHTTQAELFAMVSTIFSWKKKLRHRRVICYSDNQTAVTFVSTAMQFGKTSQDQKCVSIYDVLLNKLQETCQTYCIQLDVRWIQREHNQLADWLANGNLAQFHSTIHTSTTSSRYIHSIRTKGKHFHWKAHLL